MCVYIKVNKLYLHSFSGHYVFQLIQLGHLRLIDDDLLELYVNSLTVL